MFEVIQRRKPLPVRMVQDRNRPSPGTICATACRGRHPRRLRLLLHSGLLLAILLGFPCQRLCADVPLPPGGGTNNNQMLGWWSFNDTTWTNDSGDPPLAYTNLTLVSGGDGNAVRINDPNLAFLQYAVIQQPKGATNFAPGQGTLAFWFRPAWSGAALGGTGPPGIGRLFELGTYTTNASLGYFGLYLDTGASNLYFTVQGTNGSQNVLSTPIAWASNEWHSVIVTFSPTNPCAIYLDGALATNGPPLGGWPDGSILTQGFFLGSSSNGLPDTQAQGDLDDLQTYNYQLDAITIADQAGMFGLIYYGASYNQFIHSAPSSPGPSIDGGGFNAVTGPGWLTDLGPASFSCFTNAVVWITNATAKVTTNNQGTTFTFSIAGGTNGVPYDVFGASPLLGTNLAAAQWVWLGQGYTCQTYQLTNQPLAQAYYILGTPKDSDGDGLTDAYEILVSKTNPDTNSTYGGIADGWLVLQGLTPGPTVGTQDPDSDGLNNTQEYLYGTKPLVSEGWSIWVGDPAGVSGIP
jgi:Concanavalin A-like lectin/glucanases superfamily/Bacterial TSP3 repeat